MNGGDLYLNCFGERRLDMAPGEKSGIGVRRPPNSEEINKRCSEDVQPCNPEHHLLFPILSLMTLILGDSLARKYGDYAAV